MTELIHIMLVAADWSKRGEQWGIEDFLACFPTPGTHNEDRQIVDKSIRVLKSNRLFPDVLEKLERFAANGYVI